MTDYTKLIHDYLAGELSSEDQARLFEGLSRDPEWREEMQLQLQMERAMEKDLRSIAVPASAAAAVFASLGFRRPSKWSSMVQSSRLAAWTTQKMAVAGISGILLIGASYFVLRSPSEAASTSAKASSVQSGGSLANSMVPSSHSKNYLPATPSSVPRQVPAPGAVPVSNETFGRDKIAASSSAADRSAVSERPHGGTGGASNARAAETSFGPDEPLRYYSDIGNLYSVHYFTPQRMIGVSYDGQIFRSDDSGHSWALERSGVSSDLYGIHFCDDLHGLAVGAQGTVLRTSDGGQSWTRVASGTMTTLSTVRFITADTAYICGDDGMMLRTTNGGRWWVTVPTGVHANLFRMAFKNGLEGDVYGSNGLHLGTTDGGSTWKSIQ